MLAARELREVLFTLAVMGAIGLAVWEARAWDMRARLFPWVIGISMLILLAALLVRQLGALRRGTDRRAAATDAERDPEAALAARRGISMVGWLLAFLAAIWLLGFPAGATLGTLGYLKLSAREKWPISLAISAGTAILFAVMIYGLRTPFPRGTVFEILGL